MPIHYEIDREARRVHLRVVGHLGRGEALAALRKLLGEMPLGSSGLVDVRGIETLDLEGGEVREWVREGNDFRDPFAGTRWAIVASEGAAYGVARMYENLNLGAPFEVRTFQDIDEARAWLDNVAR